MSRRGIEVNPLTAKQQLSRLCAALRIDYTSAVIVCDELPRATTEIINVGAVRARP